MADEWDIPIASALLVSSSPSCSPLASPSWEGGSKNVSPLGAAACTALPLGMEGPLGENTPETKQEMLLIN